MEQNKKDLLLAQATKIDEIINCLSANFSADEIADETSFLAITRDNLKELAKRSVQEW
jgi:hypothetical protein